ncbi:hypothetical protein FE810_15290 [Thalassotalea litorea]|uniref:Uncharacterized protein n=1 Tax=Thalassotalea litorea TaxID=2020715 RepID=A0A5R9IC60_9GAMM|nr:hypothetical protein [Thalassotalea litorea]TLU61191.1 hypothetical protein FE810_15290 [Thalassotalea litorea]
MELNLYLNRNKRIPPLLLFLTILSLGGCAYKEVSLSHQKTQRQVSCVGFYLDWHVSDQTVDYINMHCAKDLIEQGYQLHDVTLLSVDFTVPEPPKGKQWNQALAANQYQAGLINERQYGNILGALEVAYYNSLEQAKALKKRGEISQSRYEQLLSQAELELTGSG